MIRFASLCAVVVLACGSNQVSLPDGPDLTDAAPVCGNREVEPGEQCDDGNLDNDDGCVACAFATCGDGFVRRGVEACDEASATCVRCTIPCVDGVVDAATGHCYWRVSTAATRADSAATCAAGAGHLVALDDASEWTTLAPLWVTPFPSTWLGLVRAVDGQNQWRWDTGVMLTGTGTWNPGEPNDSGGAEDCVEATGMTGGWNDLGCGQTRAALCERPTWSLDPATNRAYRVFYALRTHAESIGDCAAIGAHLVTITSAAEQAFVAALVGRDAWIGAFQGVGEGTWFWSTGERFDYTNWGPNQPDDSGGNEDCAQLVGATGAWNDRNCTARLPAVCEVD